MSLLNVYLAINWLPTSLNASGFTQSQAAVITSMYHVGGVLGTYACGLLMDRLGVRAILIFAFLLAVAGFYTFATAPAMPQWSTTLLLMATGCGVIGGQVGITTLASMIYPVADALDRLGVGARHRPRRLDRRPLGRRLHDRDRPRREARVSRLRRARR